MNSVMVEPLFENMDLDSPLKRCSSAPIISTNNNGTITPINNNRSSSGSGNTTIITNNTSSPKTGIANQRNCETPSSSSNLNIFSRTRRYSASSLSPLASGQGSSTIGNASSSSPTPSTMGSSSTSGLPRRLTPRVSQLRQEECADISNSREVNHERDLHSALQISQSWEDLTIVTENWSCRGSGDEMTPQSATGQTSSNAASPLLLNSCSSPSPTSRSCPSQIGQVLSSTSVLGLRYPVSPSPTRKTFTTRRSMSPNHVRASQLCPVKRKFDMDDGSATSSPPPPNKKMFLDNSRLCGSSSPSAYHGMLIPICPSPDSGTYEGRTTPKLFISKLCSSNSLSSFSSASASPTSQLEVAENLPITAADTLQKKGGEPDGMLMEGTERLINIGNCDHQNATKLDMRRRLEHNLDDGIIMEEDEGDEEDEELDIGVEPVDDNSRMVVAEKVKDPPTLSGEHITSKSSQTTVAAVAEQIVANIDNAATIASN